MKKSKIFPLISIIIILLSITGVTPASAGAPWSHELVSPANGATADSNPPTLCARSTGDPEGETVYIRFETWGGGEGDHHSEWIDAGSAAGNIVCWQDTGKWSEQTHSWAARAMDNNNEQSGASPDWNINIPVSQLPQPECVIEPLTTSPSAPKPVGTMVSIYAAATCTNGVSSIQFKVNGSVLDTIYGSSGTVNWNTSGYAESEYTITVEAADNSAGYIKSRSQGYTLTNAPALQPSKGPSIQKFSFNPSGGVVVGNQVSIHIKVGSSNPGAIKITVPCGSVSPIETTVPEYDATWATNGCGGGTQSIRVCARDVNDQNWANSTCETRSYTLSASTNNFAPSANFWADTETIQTGQCTYLHWTTENATSADIDGTFVNTSGDMQVCPTVTKLYSFKAKGQNGEATRSLSIVVSAQGLITVVPNNGQSSPEQTDVLPTVEWEVGARVGLCSGVQIRSGSGFNYPTHTIVPENNWQVDIIDGPRNADNVTWWNISRASIDGGGSGWVYFEQAHLGSCSTLLDSSSESSNQQNENPPGLQPQPETTQQTPSNDCGWFVSCAYGSDGTSTQPKICKPVDSCGFLDFGCYWKNFLTSVENRGCTTPTSPTLTPTSPQLQTESNNNISSVDSWVAENYGKKFMDGNCVTLARKFVNFPSFNSNGAKQYIENHPNLPLLKNANIEKDKCYVVLFKGNGTGTDYNLTFGHTAILYEYNSNSITVIEQNFQEKDKKCWDNTNGQWGVCKRTILSGNLDDNTYVLEGSCK